MNPSAAPFAPSSSPRPEILSNSFVTAGDSPSLKLDTTQEINNEDEIIETLTPFHVSQQNVRAQPLENASNPFNSSHNRGSPASYPSEMPANCYDETIIRPKHEAYAAVTPYQSTSLMGPHDYQQKVMSGSLIVQQYQQYLTALPDHECFDHQADPHYDYHQDAMQPYPHSKPSPLTVLPPQRYTYYPTHLYGRPLPIPTFHAAPPAYQHNYRIGPLPPSYPFPHLTPPEASAQAQRCFPLPYDNTAKATAYLQAFTDMYGTSSISIASLQALCLTLSHPNNETQPLPKTIRQAQNFLKKRFVNIFDLVDHGTRGEIVPDGLIFKSAADLRRYSERTRKICPASVGRGEGEDGGNELWRWMLRKWY